jgi:glycosyltransferase involved in cell wall biosynthesis
MLGWELPPFHSGGLGVACEGLTKSLADIGVEIDFILPKIYGGNYNWMNVLDASKQIFGSEQDEYCLKMAKMNKCSLVNGYQGFSIKSEYSKMCTTCLFDYDNSALPNVHLYIKGVKALCEKLDYDIIHAHDWMTYQAGVTARSVAKRKGKNAPLLVQVHATEIDRHDGKYIYDTEKRGLVAADRIVAVSNYTKKIISENYDINQKKIDVVHNGINPREITEYPLNPIKKHFKIVLYLGRITYQKGPDYFLKVAKKVIEQYPKVKFMMVGPGDMQKKIIEEGARQGLTGKLLFTSWLANADQDMAYQMADVFVMPSVSEPFGIVPLEAIQNNTPVIISKNSGISEVLDSSIKVDFWDIDKTAEEIIKVLKNKEYAKKLVNNSKEEIKKLTWEKSAKEMNEVYKKTLKGAKHA